MTCLGCGSQIPPRRGRGRPRKYCVACTPGGTRIHPPGYNAAYAAERRATYVPKPQSERDCRECGIQFVTKRSTQRFCSPRCKATFGHRRYVYRVSIGSRARKRILDRDGWRCYLCTRPIDPSFVYPHPLSPSVDHVVPVSAGGSNRYDNLRATHWHCNEQKADSLPGTEVWVPLEAA